MGKTNKLLERQVRVRNAVETHFDSIEDDFFMFENVDVLPMFSYPMRNDAAVITIIVTKGHMRGKIGLQSYEAQAPCIVTLFGDKILQYEDISDDFSGLFLVISRQMAESFLPNIRQRLPISLSLRENPSVPLSDEDLIFQKTNYTMLKKVVRMTDNLHRKEIVKLLLKAFYYISSSQLHKIPQEQRKSKQEQYLDQFLKLVDKHYKAERKIGFYANKLCVTPKYLSRIIKACTGKSANDWINEYVMLEAKTLLKSTNRNIQQISEELNFSDQSFFGKYFSRHEGISPKEYREK